MDSSARLQNTSIAIVGRLARLTRARIHREVTRRGGSLAPSLAACTLAVIGNGASSYLRHGRLVRTLGRLDGMGVSVLSERSFMRLLGLAPPPDGSARDLSVAELASLSGLSSGDVEMLALFDILEQVDGRFGFRDLILARSCRKVLEEGTELADLVAFTGAMDLRPGQDSVSRDSSGSLVIRVGQLEIERGGQFRLPLNARNLTLDEIRSEAWEAEDNEDWPRAAALYQRVLSIRPWDAVSHFNHANVLTALGRSGEAILEFRLAVHHDSGMADAWHGLGVALEDGGEVNAAIAALEQAVEADPNFVNALLRLALILFQQEAYERSVPLWQRILDLSADKATVETARKALLVCKLAREPM